MTDTLTTEEIETTIAFILSFGDLGPTVVNRINRLKAAALKGVEPKQEHVVKSGGDYTFEGTVVARFHKLSGKERVVVENSAGILHIFNPTQLSPSKQEVAGAREGLNANKDCAVQSAFQRGFEACRDRAGSIAGNCVPVGPKDERSDLIAATASLIACDIRALSPNTDPQDKTRGEKLCEQIGEMAENVGMKFTPDPEKVARFDSTTPAKGEDSPVLEELKLLRQQLETGETDGGSLRIHSATGYDQQAQANVRAIVGEAERLIESLKEEKDNAERALLEEMREYGLTLRNGSYLVRDAIDAFAKEKRNIDLSGEG